MTCPDPARAAGPSPSAASGIEMGWARSRPDFVVAYATGEKPEPEAF